MFYQPQPGDHIINHTVARISGPFCHVEIGFPSYTKNARNASQYHHLHHVEQPQQHHHTQPASHQRNDPVPTDTRVLYGASIFQNGTVFFHKKEYSRDGYTSIGVRINKQKHDALVQFCQEHALKKTPFNGMAMIRACLPFIIMPNDDSSTFCSKFVTDALQFAGIDEVNGIDSRNTTPSSLYYHIQEKMRKYAIITVSPAKLRQFHSKHPHPQTDCPHSQKMPPNVPSK